MSSFFDDASLVMIPSGYKDGKIYSVKPTSGAGDLTFTRNSNATRVDANGLIEKVRTNLTLYSNDFSNAAWVKTNVSGTSGQSGYDGTNNGWLFTSLTAANSSYHQFYSGTTEVQTFSVYLKAGTTNWVRLNLSGAGNYYFDIQNGVLGSIGTAGLMPKITEAGNGYYRCSITNTTGNSVNSIYVFAGASDGVLSTSAGDTFYIQAVQREAGGIATDYIETTTTAMSEFAGVTASSVADVPRLDYSGDCPSLLLEPQRSNVITQSEYIGAWTPSGLTITDNDTTSPEGVSNAAKLTLPSGSATKRIALGSMPVTSVARSYSFFVKSDDITAVQLVHSGDLQGYARFDISTGVVGSTGTKTTSDIEDYGNGWYRCIANFDSTNAFGSTIYLYISDSATGGYGGSTSAAGDLFIYGGQYEEGSYPTSYIPTYGTTVTRLADSCSKTGISSLIGQTEGTLFVEFEHSITNTSEDTRFILSDNTYNNWTFFSIENGTSLRYYLTSGGVNQLDATVTNVFPTAGKYKVALAYQDDLLTIYVNGVQKVNNTNTTTIPSMSALLLSGKEAVTSAVELVNKNVNQALLFTTRLSNADLANLTAL